MRNSSLWALSSLAVLSVVILAFHLDIHLQLFVQAQTKKYDGDDTNSDIKTDLANPLAADMFVSPQEITDSVNEKQDDEEKVEKDDEMNEPTCALDASKSSSRCSSETPLSSHSIIPNGASLDLVSSNQNDFIGKVISLTDENFDELTWTSSPTTWLIMFKTDSCAICKKARPVLDMLALDSQIMSHNERELIKVASGNSHKSKGDSTPEGPIFIGTVDAGWSGRDTSERFEIDATPTIIVIRSDGYDSSNFKLIKNEEGDPMLQHASGRKISEMDSRNYYVFRGQRATYPLRMFVLGGFLDRLKLKMPTPLPKDQRKPETFVGRLYENYILPNMKWSGMIVVKILGAWLVFIGVIGLFMRVHNYAWGDDDNNDENEDEEHKAEKLKKSYDEFTPEYVDEKVARRQKIMWERKMENRKKFAAAKEARRKAQLEKGENPDDDEFVAVGRPVKKSEARQAMKEYKEAHRKSN